MIRPLIGYAPAYARPRTEVDGALPPAPPLTVLVVEDYPDAAESMAEMLRLWGHYPQVVTTGADAIRVAEVDPPDVVMIDLFLPDMHGCEVVRRIRELVAVRRPLIMAVTACLRDEERRRSYESGVDLHLTKPVDPSLLRAVLSRFALLVAGVSA